MIFIFLYNEKHMFSLRDLGEGRGPPLRTSMNKTESTLPGVAHNEFEIFGVILYTKYLNCLSFVVNLFLCISITYVNFMTFGPLFTNFLTLGLTRELCKPLCDWLD